MDSASSKSKDPSQIAFLRRLKKRKQPDGEEGDKSKDKERKKPRVERKFNKPKQPRPVGQKKEKKPKEDNESSKDVKEKPKKPAKSALVELSEEKVETGAFGRFKAAVLRASRGNKSTLSKLELEDSLVNEDSVLDGKFTLDDLPAQIKKAATDWKSYVKDKSKGEGVVRILFVSSTNRCLEAQKKAREEGFSLAKLWARHLKPEEQATTLKDKKHLLGVGTPERILKLANEGHLKLDKVDLFVLDGSLDTKGFTILDGPTFAPCLDLIKSTFRSSPGAVKTKFLWLE